MTVAVLFARNDSIYKTIAQCDVYDIERDARTWEGGSPVIAHPPCRAWGELSHMAWKVRPDEKELAPWAIEKIRCFGGVLEHPKKSKLWPTLGLPKPGQRDEFGGWTLPISQFWFGHRAEKKTFLYIVGVGPKDIPDLPMQLGDAPAVIGSNSHSVKAWKKEGKAYRPECKKSEREHTPPQLALWLVELAKRCKV